MTKLVLDTNVFVSGIFWSGPPAKILNAWHEKKIKIVCSLEIIEEYRRVSSILSKKHPTVDIDSIINSMKLQLRLLGFVKQL